jgi:2-methylcitrate dehydratase PrpD
MGMTERISRFVAELRYEDIPPKAIEMAKMAVLDCLGVVLAGSQVESAKICARIALQEGTVGEATVCGHGFKSSAIQAAFVNGTAGHALDYDHSLYLGQSTSSLIPAVVSMGESLGASGRDLLVAYVAGLEVTAKIGKSITDDRRFGWQGVLGTLGSTLACAKLLRLEADKTRMALGISTSMASGIVCNYGTMTKSLHAGMAARNGILAAKLAQSGCMANPESLEAEKGFYDAFCPSPADATTLEDLGKSYELLRGIKVKPYPCAGAAHTAIDAVLDMRLRHGIVPDMIEFVDVAVTQQAFSRLGFRVPQTAIQGQFCMSYLLARAMVDGRVSIDAFTDTAVHDRHVLELAEKVHMRLDPELSKNTEARLVSKVKISVKNGQSFTRRVDYAKGSLVVPLTAGELKQKFLDCAIGVLAEEEAIQVLDGVMCIEAMDDIKPFCQLLGGRPLA